MANLQSELAARAQYLPKKEIWKLNIQKDGVRKSFYSKTPGTKGRKECAARAAEWYLSDGSVNISARTTVDDLFARYALVEFRCNNFENASVKSACPDV